MNLKCELRIGDRIHHQALGFGVVVGLRDGAGTIVKIKFERGGVKELAWAFAMSLIGPDLRKKR